MLTNNHCFDNSDDAYDTEVWFNYQCAQCGGYDVFRPTKVWGDRVLATDRTLDYTLFTRRATSPQVQKFGYLTLDTAPAGARARSSTSRSTRPASPTRIADRQRRRAGRQLRGRGPAYDGYANDIGRLVLLRHRGRLVRLAGAVPARRQGGGAAPLRRLPELGRPGRPDLQRGREPALARSRAASCWGRHAERRPSVRPTGG